MELDKKYYAVIFASVIGISILMGCKEQSNAKQSNFGASTPIMALEQFCENEFIGNVVSARYDYARMDSEHERIEKKITGEEPPQIDAHPMVIVSTYHIIGIDSTQNTGRVIYERLAYTQGIGTEVNFNPNPPRKIIPEYKKIEEISYALRKIDGKWYVYNPPIMRVSLAAVVKCYMEQDMSAIPQDFWIEPRVQTPGRRNITKIFDDMRVLMQLSVDYLKRLEEKYKNQEQ